MDFGAIAGGLGELAKTAAPLLAVGFGIKHGDAVPILKKVLGPATKRVPNDLIPWVNIGVDIALGGDGSAGLTAVGIHQVAKAGARALIGKLAGGLADKLNKVGPGERVSI